MLPAHEIFERERSRLLSIAYGLLGSLAEAQDVVQDAYLRFESADVAALRQPAAWLTTVVSRLALDLLRSARRRREVYPGEWLPEPVFDAPLQEQRQITRSRLSIALLHLLETLGPEERAVFVLREVFERSYAEIAEIVGKSAAACRQAMTRARQRIAAQAPATPAPPDLAEQFLAALDAGDEHALMQLLAPDAVLYGDGGGKALAVVNPVFGAERIVRFYLGLRRKYGDRFDRRPSVVNGEPGLIALLDGAMNSVTALAWRDGRITALYNVLNPDKLHSSTGSQSSVAYSR
ncbi:MAG: RNA polymerase sigma factor SigJ [Bryobacterales bacterium]